MKSTHRDPLSRQTTEAVLIEEAMETGIIPDREGAVQISSVNRKEEYFCAGEIGIREIHLDLMKKNI